MEFLSAAFFFSFQILVDLIVLMSSPLGVLMNGAVQPFVGYLDCIVADSIGVPQSERKHHCNGTRGVFDDWMSP